jgi:hypothetical protein
VVSSFFHGLIGLCNVIKLRMLTLYFTDFKPVGNISSYKFTETSSASLSSSDREELVSELSYDCDWALVRIQPSLYSTNSYLVDGDTPENAGTIFVEGWIPTKELDHGMVQILHAGGKASQGYLGPNNAYWEIGKSCFEVRTVFLEDTLSKFDILSANDMMLTTDSR